MRSIARAAEPGGQALFDRWALRAERWALGAVSYEEIHQAFLPVEEEDPFRVDKGSWMYELRAAGCEHDAQGVLHDKAGEAGSALQAYERALVYYNIARFPLLATPQREHVYQRMLDLYVRIGDLSGNPMREIAIPMGEHEIRGYLRLPKGIDNPALIIMTGGLDTWKPSFDRYLLPMNEAGFATFIFEMPGTGFNPIMLDADGYKVHSRVIEFFTDYEGIDGTKIGAYTASFSGAIGLQLALVDPNVGAVVDNGGGAHYLYAEQPKIILPPGSGRALRPMQQAILWTLGFRENMDANPGGALDAWVDELPSLSLQTQGILKATPGQAPLLHIHGGKDDLIPIEDFELVGASGVQEDVLFYPEDDHCAPQNFADHHPKAMAWFKEKLAYAP